MSPTRRWHRIASATLLISAGAHLGGHWVHYVRIDPADGARIAARDAMQAVVLFEALGTTLWTALGFFSLAFSLMLILFGTSQWILAREADPLTLRRHALRNALLCLCSALAVLVLHPVPQGLVIFLASSILYGIAAWPRLHDR